MLSKGKEKQFWPKRIISYQSHWRDCPSFIKVTFNIIEKVFLIKNAERGKKPQSGSSCGTLSQTF